MQRGVSSVVQLLLLLGCLCAVATGYLFRTPLDLDVTPRVTVLNSGKDRHEHVLHLALKSSVPKFIPTFISELLEAVFFFLTNSIIMQSTGWKIELLNFVTCGACFNQLLRLGQPSGEFWDVVIDQPCSGLNGVEGRALTLPL